MPDSWDDSMAGGQNIRFEETLNMRDEAGGKPYIKYVYLLVVFLIVTAVVGGTLVVWSAMDRIIALIGGVDVMVSHMTSLWSERPFEFVAIVLIILFSVFYMVALLGGFLLSMRGAFDKQVHTRVTDSGVSVRREGSWLGQSSRADIAFDAITGVEYLDPEESSTRLEMDDLRSKQFFAGRSKNWIRVERGDAPTVYIGSDRPLELAEAIVRRSPGVESAEPF
jgi:hypothetical protein